MANRRMLSKSISTSVQVNKLSIKAKLLFTWMIPHADDDGRMKGEAEHIMGIVVPLLRWTIKEIQTYLLDIEKAGLIHIWQDNGEQLLHFPKWKSHQTLQNDRYHKSTLPPCPLCINNGWIQAGYNLEPELNLIKDNLTELNKDEDNNNEKEVNKGEREYEGKPPNSLSEKYKEILSKKK